MKKKLRNWGIGLFVLLLLANVLIAVHCYKLTHVDEDAPPLGYNSLNVSFLEKLKVAIGGIDYPKPKAASHPNKGEEITIKSREGDLSGWLIKSDSLSLGTVLLFHGFMDQKSAMLPKAEVFLKIGYDVLLVDFMGAGDSYGNQTTMGYLEAQNVIDVYEYVNQNICPEGKIYLSGFSMGAVAIMKALHDQTMKVDGVILEAPYSTLRNTVGSRAVLLGFPVEPVASIFTFWIGAVNGFNGFDMEPIRYAKSMEIPVLLLCGEEDPYISNEEVESIYDALASKDKTMHLFESCFHESYLAKHPQEWIALVNIFLNKQNRVE